MSEILIGTEILTAKGHRGKINEVLPGGYLLDDGRKVRAESIARVISSPPATGQTFYIGDRVTMLDKFMVRAADVGTVEAMTQDGIRVLWDNNSPHEPHLKQAPVLFRTFTAAELELIESKFSQN